MALILSFFIFIISLFANFGLGNISTTKIQANDTSIKSDINSIYANLEVHYNEYGFYPTVNQFYNDWESEFPGLSEDTFFDEDGNTYFYTPEDCGAVGCEKYTLYANLSDGTKYEKVSLN